MIEHETVGRMAVLPLLIKLASFLFVTFLSIDHEKFLLQGVLLAPAYFAEGWLMAHLVRLAFFGEREIIPLRLLSNSRALVMAGGSRARGILAGAIIYLLIKLSVMGFWALMVASGGTDKPPEIDPAYTADVYLAAMIMLIGMIWAFRFVWIYIPAALDFSVADFLKSIKGFRSSFSMIGVWILCYLPLALLLKMAMQTITAVFPETEGVDMHDYSLAGTTAIMETIIGIVATIAMTFAISSLYKEPPKNS